jgi:hypothetical protein
MTELFSQKTKNLRKEKEKKISQKYHMIKFFERKKLTRKIRQLESQLKTSTTDDAKLKLEREITDTENDLAVLIYVM